MLKQDNLDLAIWLSLKMAFGPLVVNATIIIVMFKFLLAMGGAGLGGLVYLKYYEYSKINRDIQQLIASNELAAHLYETNQQSAFSIDSVMDAFERGYNQFSVSKYRETLAGLCKGKVLETCAGSNRNLRFYKSGTDLTLIDYSPNMVGIGSSKSSPLVKYRYIVGDVMAMPFSDNEFDCVIDTFGLQYTLNPHRVLQEIRRVCKRGGKIVLMNEGLSNIVEFHYYENVKWGYNLMRGGYFSNRNWEKLVKEFDFEIEHQERKKNGRLYIFVLKNSKNDSKSAKPVPNVEAL